MPRRPAAERHTDSQPQPDTGQRPTEYTLPTVDALVTIAHPLRRRMLEVLRVDGPASVGQLADRLGVAVGSISHHVKALHANGFVVPAPELAKDTRESWWRSIPVKLSWSRFDFAEGSTAREIAEIAARANVEHHLELIRASIDQRNDLPPQWDRAGMISDSMVRATREQVAELSRRLTSLVDAWRATCVADAEEHPDADREAVLVATYALPVKP